MTHLLRGRERLLPLAVVAALLAGMVTVAWGQDDLRRDRAFAVVTPRDGAQVGSGFLVSWAPGAGPAPGGYAVVVDEALPAPGHRLAAGTHTLLLRDTALRLDLGPASSGSPSARRFHTVQVVRLDEAGRRLGEDVAVVHVRTPS